MMSIMIIDVQVIRKCLLPINPATNRNTMNDRLPMRWMYPKSESDYNLEHQNEALERQFGGVDDVNKLMWILQ